jgi:hypothetical protein
MARMPLAGISMIAYLMAENSRKDEVLHSALEIEILGQYTSAIVLG